VVCSFAKFSLSLFFRHDQRGFSLEKFWFSEDAKVDFVAFSLDFFAKTTALFVPLLSIWTFQVLSREIINRFSRFTLKSYQILTSKSQALSI